MKQFKRILVPVDFEPATDEAVESGGAIDAAGQHVELSAASMAAVAMAAGLARVGPGGKLYLVHVTPAFQTATMYTGPVSLPVGVLEEIQERAREAALAVLRHLTEKLCGGCVVEHIVGPGQTAQGVIEEAGRIDADLIVMAASGRSRVARFFVGSTADRVIRESPCPVLVIPAR
ncbi:MAG: universal stress protein [Deltaproteobacteria bacterium]|nr:universal stress protein [Nannocystaceae bacterium]